MLSTRNAVKTNPMSYLDGLSKAANSIELKLPYERPADPQWSGMAFVVGKNLLFARKTDVREIMRKPVIRKLPGSKPWFLGVTNLTGRLVPVTDFALFLGLTKQPRDTGDVIVVEYNGASYGFLVDGVHSIHPMPMQKVSTSVEGAPKHLKPIFIGSAMIGKDKSAFIVDFSRVARSPSLADSAKS